jgi:hypothetical protein
MSKVTKRDMNALDKELSLFLHECVSKAPKHRYRMKYTTGTPLTAWMAGAPKNCESKIISVQNKTARYPYRTKGEGALIVYERMVKNKKLTDIQHYLLCKAVSNSFAGKNKFGFWDYEFSECAYPTRNWFVLSELSTMFQKISIDISYHPPLNFLLSEKATDLLLLKCLYKEIVK